ncbi:hypothetical protein [Mycobacterium avium]|uniref:hypothetical protein n=1 Tax=Mycobacterium avium TaxID=1764 RepID=UPI0009B8859E|nr:hypothetical protein [Mycobacterium avium]MBZ4571573.1 hypothetical protein [Mycobacterium avium subsp. hominissuis]
MAQVIQVRREGAAVMADEAIRLPAGVWLDSMRIDCTNDDGPEPELLAEWSCVDGWVEISVPVDLGALGETVTVRFPGWLIPGITQPRSVVDVGYELIARQATSGVSRRPDSPTPATEARIHARDRTTEPKHKPGKAV